MFVRCKTLTFGPPPPPPGQWKLCSLTFAMIKITTAAEKADVLCPKSKKKKKQEKNKEKNTTVEPFGVVLRRCYESTNDTPR